jgi:hypothetical protein
MVAGVVGSEAVYLQEFAKIHLANIVIWQLAKIYGK